MTDEGHNLAERRDFANKLIDQAIRENRVGEWLTYGFAVVFVLSGLLILITAIVIKDPIIGACGTVTTSLFYPAMHSAKRTRKENIALRLLVDPMSKAVDSNALSDVITRIFDQLFGDEKGGSN